MSAFWSDNGDPLGQRENQSTQVRKYPLPSDHGIMIMSMCTCSKRDDGSGQLPTWPRVSRDFRTLSLDTSSCPCACVGSDGWPDEAFAGSQFSPLVEIGNG